MENSKNFIGKELLCNGAFDKGEEGCVNDEELKNFIEKSIESKRNELKQQENKKRYVSRRYFEGVLIEKCKEKKKQD